MHSRVLRLLVLTSSLFLALPAGWCCAALTLFPAPTEPVSPCCRHKQTPPAERETPRPLHQGDCPCDERLTTAPDHTWTFDGAPSALVPFDIVVPAALLPEAAALVDTPPPPTASSLHLLHCLWRC